MRLCNMSVEDVGILASETARLPSNAYSIMQNDTHKNIEIYTCDWPLEHLEELNLFGHRNLGLLWN